MSSPNPWRHSIAEHLAAFRIVTTVILALGILPKGGICDDGLGYNDTPRLPNSPWRVHDRERPQPPMVSPGIGVGTPPADAVVLFNGKDLAQWEGGDAKGIEDGAVNILKTGQLTSKRHFGDCQLHVEWATPAVADGGALDWGNSGVLFLGKYELQIIESHASKIYADGIAGAVYGQTPPLVNASRKAGEWQSFDVIFSAPRFDGDRLIQPAYFTVFWNSVLVQYHTPSLGPVKHKVVATYDSRETTGPIVLQHHNSAVRFRNIWVRPLNRSAEDHIVTERSVRVPGDSQESRYLLFIPPVSADGTKYPLIVHLYGAGGSITDYNLARPPYAKLRRIAAERGYCLLVPELGGSHWMNERARRTLDAVIADAIAKNPIDGKRVHLMGTSMGGGAFLAYVVHRPELVRSVCAIFPMTDLVQWVAENPGYLNSVAKAYGGLPKQAPGEWAAASAMRNLEAFRNIPVLLIHGDADTTVLPHHSRRFAQALRSKQYRVVFHEVQGAGHVDEMVEPFQQEILDFFDQADAPPGG